MAVTLPPSLSRLIPTTPSTGTARTEDVSAPEESAPSGEAASTSPALDNLVDAFEQVSALQQAWASKFSASAPVSAAENPAVPELAPANLSAGAGAQPPQVDWMDDAPPTGEQTTIKQTKDTDCGAATAAILANDKGKPTAASPDQLMNELDSRFATVNGTTPKQMTDMLAHEGLEVVKGTSIVDPNSLDEALSQGKKAVAMVDSSKIEGSQDPGKPHWVVIDGKDDQGNYSVKDPATGTSYKVGLNELTDAVNSGWGAHNSGGMMIVDRAQDGVNESALAEKNGVSSQMLGTNPGIGSNAKSINGRESS